MPTITRTGSYNPARVLDELIAAHPALIEQIRLEFTDAAAGRVNLIITAPASVDVDAVLSNHDPDGLTPAQARAAAREAFTSVKKAAADDLVITRQLFNILAEAATSTTPTPADIIDDFETTVARDAALATAYERIKALVAAAFAGNQNAQIILAQFVFMSPTADLALLRLINKD